MVVRDVILGTWTKGQTRTKFVPLVKCYISIVSEWLGQKDKLFTVKV